jgi:hypothetical protein
LLPIVFVLEPEPDPLGGVVEDESEPLELVSGDGEEEDHCVFVPAASTPADEEDNEGGVGGGGMANERLELFVPIMGEASAADGEE